MENERLTFEQVCEQYEFADWELAELLEQGAICVATDEAGKHWFEVAEIIRFIRETPNRVFSFPLAEKVYRRSRKTLRHQAAEKKLKAKRVGKVWTVTSVEMAEYIEKYSRNI